MSTQLNHIVSQRLTAPGPKRILALDGGGIRGAITLGFLAQLEAHLRDRHNNPNLLLCDYFDLIGGTSTGSIIAASLAIGMNVTDIQEAYCQMGDVIFERPARWFQIVKMLRQNLFYKNRPAAIERILQKFYSDKITHREFSLGDTAIKTGLCVVTKRVDTFSVWHMHNNPLGRYYDANKDIPLWRVVRASSAAPTFFPPTLMPFDVAGRIGAFVDGGVSAFNNPAAQLFFMATLKGFHLEWPSGEDKLMIVSVGTGTTDIKFTTEEVRQLGKKNAIFWGSIVPDMFIKDCSDHNEMLMQSLSNSPTARKIDGEIGKLEGEYLAGAPRLHYLRYNTTLADADLQASNALTQSDPKRFPPIKNLKGLMRMDAGQNVFHLSEVGKRAAEQALSRENFEAHFPKGFDLKPQQENS